MIKQKTEGKEAVVKREKEHEESSEEIVEFMKWKFPLIIVPTLTIVFSILLVLLVS